MAGFSLKHPPVPDGACHQQDHLGEDEEHGLDQVQWGSELAVSGVALAP